MFTCNISSFHCLGKGFGTGTTQESQTRLTSHVASGRRQCCYCHDLTSSLTPGLFRAQHCMSHLMFGAHDHCCDDEARARPRSDSQRASKASGTAELLRVRADGKPGKAGKQARRRASRQGSQARKSGKQPRRQGKTHTQASRKAGKQ